MSFKSRGLLLWCNLFPDQRKCKYISIRIRGQSSSRDVILGSILSNLCQGPPNINVWIYVFQGGRLWSHIQILTPASVALSKGYNSYSNPTVRGYSYQPAGSLGNLVAREPLISAFLKHSIQRKGRSSTLAILKMCLNDIVLWTDFMFGGPVRVRLLGKEHDPPKDLQKVEKNQCSMKYSLSQ